MPTLQILVAKTNKIEDSLLYLSLLEKVFKTLQKAKGLQSISYGMAMDWEDTLVIYTIWDSLLRSHDFIKSPAYPDFVEALNRLSPEFPKITHTEIESLGKELQEVMTSPCIEMAPLTAKKDHIGILYHNFKTAGKMIAAQPGYVGQFMNNQIEAPFTQWSLVAWESIKAHEDYGKSPDFPDFLKYVEPCVDMPGPPPIIHVKLKPVSAQN